MIKISDVRLKESSDNSEKIKDAEQRKSSANETMEEAWERIFNLKNSDREVERLKEVKQAMEEGRIGREPAPEGRKQGKFSREEALRLFQVLEVENRERRLQEMKEEMPSNYWTITDERKLRELTSLVAKEDEIVFDVETTGTDVWEDYIVGHVISAVKADIHAYIPTKHNTKSKQLPHDLVTKHLKPIYEDVSVGKIAHNASFDIHMLDREGITLKGLTWDTQEAMKILNENEQLFALKPLVTKYLGIDSQTYGELFGQKGFHEVGDLKVATSYAAKDGDITLKLRDFQRNHLSRFPKMLQYYEEVEVPLIPIVVEMEKEGYEIDLEYAKEYGDQLRKEAEEYGEKVFSVLGDINLNSPAQLKKAIEDHIGRKIKNTNAKETLKPLAKEFDIIDDLLKYREVNKLLSTYIGVLPTLIKEKTGRVHTGLYPNGTVTGRFSSGSNREDGATVSNDGLINVQNQPKEARSIFVAPKGYYIVNADFSSQEVRIIASLSGEKILLDAFKEGRDAYATLASEFFGLPYEDCYKLPDGSDTEYRKQMKVVLLSSMYGASKYGLSGSLGISVDEAEQFRLDFFDKYRKIDAFIKETQDFARKHGYVWIGDKQRKRRLPDARRRRTFIPRGKWNDPKYAKAKKNNRRIGASMRQGPNAKVQGLAAMQTKTTILELDKVAKERGWRHFGPIHDEVVLLMPTNSTEEDFAKLDEVMTQTFLLDGVDNQTDIEIQLRWGDSITVEDYLAGKEVPSL